MKLRLSGPVLLLLPILAGAMAAGAQTMYKWVDEQGRVTYSDQPPTGKVKSQEQVKVAAPLTSGAATAVAKQETQFKKRQDDAEKKLLDTAKKVQADAVRADSCRSARGDLRAIRDNVPMVRMTESGERVIMDSAAREAEGRRLQSFIEDSCAQAGG